jgi:hypothetical protein
MPEIIYDVEKLKELIIYVALKCESDPWCGSTKLNKILFFADFLSYRATGVPITGARYQKLEHGPAPVALVPLRRQMELEGSARLRESKVAGAHIQKRIVALRDPKLNLFAAAEIAMVDQVIEAFRDATARAVSDLSHDLPGWQLAALHEEIPYETACLPDEHVEAEPVTQEEMEWATQVAAEL